jgi:hypothetical protein
MLVHDLNDRAKKAYERTLIEKDNEIKRVCFRLPQVVADLLWH